MKVIAANANFLRFVLYTVSDRSKVTELLIAIVHYLNQLPQCVTPPRKLNLLLKNGSRLKCLKISQLVK